MTTLAEKRHTLAHLLAAVVLERYPHAKPTIGPAVETGFYYDFDFTGGDAPGEADLEELTEAMRTLLPSWTQMTGEEVRADVARSRFNANEYKQELISGIEEANEAITLYTSGSFTDLCRGGHAEHPAAELAVDAFMLDRISGAYWRGDEQNAMLTRIYGIAFDTKVELDAYVVQREEARKRDHRKLGVELDLFTFSHLVGSGMPLFTPRGATIRSEIVHYSRELNHRLGFGEVHTPNINKAELFKTSGHYDQYKEDMLTVSSQYVKDEMFLKPMNCPQHTQIYASKPRSYRDLPIRYADFATLYRDERPGELSGLTRLRAFAQDDGHIFCREDQVKEELMRVLAAIQEALTTYDIGYWIRLSLRDSNNKEKYLGTDEIWEQSQNELREILKETGIEFKEAEGEAAFYGPKLDIIAVDALGREWQISTIQIDRTMPGRFDLSYTAEDGSKHTPVMIHRALVGSPDRFLGILIEHYGGAFPTWLAPLQTRVLPVSDKHDAYAQEILKQLLTADIRADLETGETLGKRIRAAKVEKLPYVLVVGDSEMNDRTVTVESRDEGKLDPVPLGQFITRVKSEIETRR